MNRSRLTTRSSPAIETPRFGTKLLLTRRRSPNENASVPIKSANSHFSIGSQSSRQPAWQMNRLIDHRVDAAQDRPAKTAKQRKDPEASPQVLPNPEGGCPTHGV